eukprot:CAMPEP_0197273174 /NCGR_PEP_ID=MMETSP1432-20130617/10920_1 /TAXON_ID=44447 /ORGANISM="Pseudo-nitzschia delicatissima, Strain UNC1205" /LENGTH=108 /DNA_ID=CAMNT_0042738815 /DNA_START=191 /DNA_END=517 /DNA_ORIENTATION=-
MPVFPGLPSRSLKSRGLLLGKAKHRRHFAHPAAILHASSPPSIPSLGSSSHINTLQHDPGPLEGLSTTIIVECKGCGGLVQGVSKNAIALECPSCQKCYPMVTCRVVQ